MKKLVIIMALLFAGIGFVSPTIAVAYNFGDFRSETLVGKAWGAYSAGDIEGVLAYTNKCLELYADQAAKMQASLTDYPQGANDEVFAYWALNDVATALFIQGESYRQADMKDEAIEVYNKIIDEYKYGQAWDANGWFWKPAEAAKEKIAMLKSGSNLDFGDYSSSFLAGQAWKALNDGNTEAVIAYVNKINELYEKNAVTMQESLTEYPWESKEKIFSYWALNDLGAGYYIKGEALKKAGNIEGAKKAYKRLTEEFFYAQCWDPQGWFWKPAEAAQSALDELEDM